MDQGVSGLAAKNRRTVLADEPSQDSGYVAAAGGDGAAELAVPVTVKGAVVAVIAVDGAAPAALDESDVTTLETLADQLAVAIQNIQLYHEQREQSRRLAVAEERDRIGRDLHDGVIQSIYAVGLTLEDIAYQAPQEPGEVPPRLEGAVGDLNRVIGGIRSYIMDLRPRELQGRRFDEALRPWSSTWRTGPPYPLPWISAWTWPVCPRGTRSTCGTSFRRPSPTLRSTPRPSRFPYPWRFPTAGYI